MRTAPMIYHRIDESPEPGYLREILDDLARSRTRIEIEHDDGYIDRGRIGWTTGNQTAIVVNNARSLGGSILDAYDIVAIRSTRKDGPTYYQRPEKSVRID